MPRQARIDIPGALHHIICRGIESDGRILGDSDFVDDVLNAFEAEELEKKCHYHRHNVDLAEVISVVATAPCPCA